MRLTFETMLAPANGSSGLQAAAQAFLDALNVTAVQMNYLSGIVGNVQSRLNGLASLSGTAFTGNVTLFATPSLALHAASKGYVDALTITGKVPVAGGTMTGALALSGDATVAMQITTKQQMTASIAAAVANTANVTDLTTGFPQWNTAVNGQVGSGWPTFQSKLQAIITEVRKAPLASYAPVTASGVYPGASGFHGGVLLPDGRVFCVPSGSTTARIYDPVTDTLVTPTGTYPGVSAFCGGVLLKDGRVFCVPNGSSTARIYDPMTDTLSTPGGSTAALEGSYWGGVLLPDGRVFCVPCNETIGLIYNPATNSLSNPPGVYPGSSAFYGGVLLPDGRVFLVPGTSTTARIYDPVANTLVIPNGTYPGNSAFVGGVLLPDGRVFCVPYNSTTARIYDPVTNTVSTPAGTYPGSDGIHSGTLLPDGRVYCHAWLTSNSKIYDPVTNTQIIAPGVFSTVGLGNGVLLPDGRIFCVPFNATAAVLLVGSTSNLSGNKKLPMSLVLSPFFNKR